MQYAEADLGRLKKLKKVLLIIMGILVIIFLVLLNSVLKNDYVKIANIEFVSYNKNEEKVHLLIEASHIVKECALATEIVDDPSALMFVETEENKCRITIPLEEHFVYFKNNIGGISEPLSVNNYIGDPGRDNYYLALNETYDLSRVLSIVGNVDYSWQFDANVVQIINNVMTGRSIGKTTIELVVNNKIIKTANVVVTDGIVPKPMMFDTKKAYLPCGVYDSEKAELMDTILKDRIEAVGYGTRAGAVEAARFLTLEFPYRINYFYENGRVNGTGVHYADGEGRYYNQGLYLNEDKFDDLKYIFGGPATWGCPLINYHPDPNYGYIPYTYKPNGLDCSGFVTWALLNGGFDVGDVGAGETPRDGQLTDIGDYTALTQEELESGKIKVGDLFNRWGHISIIVGVDDENFYVAETLASLKGLVIKTYAKGDARKTWSHVVYMDKVYKEDGKLTDMWY